MASAYDKVVAPGATGSVKVEFDSAGKIGIVNKTICIMSNSISNDSQGDFLNIKVNIIL